MSYHTTIQEYQKLHTGWKWTERPISAKTKSRGKKQSKGEKVKKWRPICICASKEVSTELFQLNVWKIEKEKRLLKTENSRGDWLKGLRASSWLLNPKNNVETITLKKEGKWRSKIKLSWEGKIFEWPRVPYEQPRRPIHI